MTDQEEKIIEQDKSKVKLLASGAVIFLILGITFLSLGPEFITYFFSLGYNYPKFIYAIGLALVIFGGLMAAISIMKVFDNSPGLVLTPKGFEDNSNLLSCGFVPWSEVEDIQKQEFRHQVDISIKVQNPEKYANQGNILKKLAKRANLRLSGTPIHISPNYLQIESDRLFSLLREYHENFTAYQSEQ